MSTEPQIPALTMLTEDEQLFRDAVHEFAQGEIAPRSAEMDRQGRYDEGLIKSLFDMGVMGIEVPEELGGAGGSFFLSVLAVEEISRADAAVGVLVDVHNTLFVNALVRLGDDEQKQKYLPRTAADTVAAYALSEAGSGSDAFALAARAEPDGEGWLLNGQKLWITNASEAALFLIFANADPDQGYRGITAFIVEREGRKGLQIRDRDPQRGADRDRSPDGRCRRGGYRVRDAIHTGALAVREADQ
jgi:alkylation response protein AidB-like acyl-CoA dehydrogenase